ncbi:hypothetical protein [Pseudomonas sp. B21-012]
MIKDHTKANQHLLDLARQHGFMCPGRRCPDQQGALDDAAGAGHRKN